MRSVAFALVATLAYSMPKVPLVNFARPRSAPTLKLILLSFWRRPEGHLAARASLLVD